ncbi:MAG: tetratricopeptide repeat protein [Candidatus Omnitrophota bacterium]|nr:tetratricopeptide repeat protein [Candidatus Omnitrophota bacterium]
MAQKAFEDGFYDASLGFLERFLKNYPDSAKAIEANLLVGECYFHQHKFTAALAKFEELLKDPQSKSIRDVLYYWMAEVNFKGDNFTQASLYYKNIIQEFPVSAYAPAAYYSLGWCLFQEHRFKDAIGYFQALIKKYPQEPQAKDAGFKIIECLYNLKDYAQLKERINSNIDVFPKDALRVAYLYFYLGEADYYLGDFDGALAAYAKVLTNSPDAKMQALTKLDLGWAYLKLKRYQEAEDVFLGIKQSNLEKGSRDILLLGRAIASMETNRIHQAKKLYEELSVQASDPLISIQGLIGRADALYNLADYAEASKAYQEALAKVNLKGAYRQIIDKLYYNLGWSLLKQGYILEAITAFQRVIDLSSDATFRAGALCQIGDAYQEGADYKKAEEAYKLLLKEYPGSHYNDYTLYQLGSVCLKEAKINEAILNLILLEKKFSSSKFLDDAAYTLGLAYFNKQDYNLAKETLKKFQDIFKNSDLRPKALYLLGNCLYSLGDYPSAIQVFKEIPRFTGIEAELEEKAEYGVADALYQMGQEEEALARFKALRSKYPGSSLAPDILWWLGSYYYQHNEVELAQRYFLSLIQDFPKSNLLADAYYGLGLTLMDGPKAQEALDNFRKALALNNPEIKPKAAVAMAEIEEAKGNIDQAAKDYLEAIKLSGQDNKLTATVLLRLGRIYEDKNNIQEALKVYSKILDMNIAESKYAEERIASLKPSVK